MMFNWGLWGVLSVQVCVFHLACSSLRTFNYIWSTQISTTFSSKILYAFEYLVRRTSTPHVLNLHLSVYSLYLLECIQIGLSSADIFYWFAKGWGQLSYLADPHFAQIDMPMVAGVIAMVVQLYFTWRIWILGSCLPLCIVIALVSIGQGIAGFVSGIQVQISL